MNTLRSLQANFIAAVVDGEQSGLNRNIIQTSIPGYRRIQIYHNNIYISLTNALSAVFPVIQRLVGDDFFGQMAINYIQLYPSRSGNLHEFGNEFPAFIEQYNPARELVYLSDVARLEWAYHWVFHAADSHEFDIQKLQQVNTEDYHRLIFTPNPACRILNSAYPILKIWQANQPSLTQNNIKQTGSEIIRLNEGGINLLVIRKALDIEIQRLDEAEFAFLNAIFNRKQFFAACDAATSKDPLCDISQLLLKHLQNQTLIDSEIPDQYM